MKIFPKKLSLRLMILLSLLFVLVLSFIKLSFQSNKTTSSTPISLSSISPKLTSFFTPTPTLRHFTNNPQNISITIPKYLDITDERETYEINFAKASPDSQFYLTTDIFPRLVILDQNYEFSFALTKEVVGDITASAQAFTKINTNQFGTLKKIQLGNDYKYVTDYYAVNLFPKQKTTSSYALITCRITGTDQGECDQLISTLSVKLL